MDKAAPTGRTTTEADHRRRERQEPSTVAGEQAPLLLIAPALSRGDPGTRQWLRSAGQAAQRRQVAAALGQRQGNRLLQHQLAAITDTTDAPRRHIQREDGEDEEEAPSHETPTARAETMSEERSAETPVTEVVVTEEEARQDLYGAGPMPTTEEIEANMQRDLAITEGSENILYIDMPGLIGGMPYRRDFMQGIFATLRDARNAITEETVYRQWHDHPEDPQALAALNQRIAQFEREVGTGIRQQIRNYWQGESGDPTSASTIAAGCTEIGNAIEAERLALFPEGSELPGSLTIAEPNPLKERLRAQWQRIGSELLPLVRNLGLGRGEDRRARQSLETLRTRIDQVRQIVDPSLSRRQVQTLSTRWTQAVASAREAAQSFTTLANQIAESGRRAGVMATAVMDPQTTPILVPMARRTAAVTFRGERSTYHTHHESRMSYYREAFMLTGAPPERSLSQVPTQGGNTRQQRVRQVFDNLCQRGTAVSEAKMLAAIAYSEGSFGSTQSVDMVRFSWGILSFQGGALMGVLRRLREQDPAVFQAYFEDYGITIRERGRSPQPTEQTSREMSGRAEGVQSHEALGVSDLLVYDHRTRVWVSGNEGLAVIQSDPRYQALFVAAGNTTAAQAAQMEAARGSFIHSVRNEELTLGSAPNQHTLQVKDFVNSEVAMFCLVERKVASGNIGFATAMFQAYLRDRQIEATALPMQPQTDIAAWVRGYRSGARWELADNLEPAGIPALSDSTYQGQV